MNGGDGRRHLREDRRRHRQQSEESEDMTRRSTRAFRAAAALIPVLALAACATPRELRRPVPRPALDTPVAVPDLPAYTPPTGH
jgi:hypothetical protein